MYNFIPNFHFRPASEKLTKDWCWDAVTWCYYHTNNRSLLQDKNVNEIIGYATGNFSMREFKRMYKSEAKKMDSANANNSLNVNSNGAFTDEIGYAPLPLIPTKVNAAIATVEKIPQEVKATAQDPLAVAKKEEDIAFLKNRPAIEAQLQGLADKMDVGEVDLGTTKHSAVPFSNSPYGLDLNEPDELDVFVNLLYNLGVEAAFETILEIFNEIKNGQQVRLLNIKDQFYYGVSANTAFRSAMTGLPDIKYEFPGNISTPYSNLPDYSDRTHQFISERITVMELFNYFGDEIPNEEVLAKIINAKETGYCSCNDIQPQKEANFNQFKVDLVYFEVKSVDYVIVAPLNKKSKFSYVSEDATDGNKVWGQNTYCFWWLKGTKYFFGIHRLDYAHRTLGQESYQNFSTSIYKSIDKSAVEMSISENKKAQIADIKLQHTVIHSLPAGKYLNLKFLRSALSSLVKEESNTYTMNDLINLAMEKNWFIGDTEGFDGKNDGQLKPFEDIPGGLKTEIVGYLQIISDAANKISQFTGINEQLTGQSANPEGLIGLQKLLINSSINALYYVNVAITNLEKNKYNIWGNIVKQAIEDGGKTKDAIVNLIGSKKVGLIESVKDVPLHTIGITISSNQREEEAQDFKNEVIRLKNLGILNTVDDYMLSVVTNKRDKMALLAVKYKQWEKKQAIIRQEAAQQQQAAIQQQGQNQMEVQGAKTDGDIKKVYAQGDVSSQILKLAAELGIQASQLDGVIKKALQQARGDEQLNKSIQTLNTKQTLDNQQAYQ